MPTLFNRVTVPILALFSTIVFFIATYSIAGIATFETNDDPVLNMMASGIGFSDFPTDHLLYSHFMIGKLLNRLYQFSSTTPWYGLYLLSAQFFSIFAAACLIIKKQDAAKCIAGLLFLIAYFIAVCLRPVELMQFTTTAALVSSVAALYLIAALEPRDNADKSLYLHPGLAATSFAFFILASMIRFGSAKLILALTAVVFAGIFLKNFDYKRLLAGLLSVSLMFAVVTGIEEWNTRYYARDAWSEFYDLNVVRFEVSEFDRFNKAKGKTRLALSEAGWSQADLTIFLNWYILDPELYSIEKLTKIDKILPRFEKENAFKRTKTRIRQIAKDCTIWPCLTIIFLVWLFLDRNRFPLRGSALFAIMFLVISIFFTVTMKFPAKIYCSMLGFSALLCIWYASTNSPMARFLKNSSKPIRCSIFLSMLLLLSVSLYPPLKQYRSVSKNYQKSRIALEKSIEKLSPSPENLYIAWSTSIPYEVASPYQNPEEIYQGIKLLGINFLARSPLVQERLAQWKISNLLLELDRDDIFLISQDFINRALQDYLARKHGIRATFEPILIDEKAPLRVFKAKYSKLE